MKLYAKDILWSCYSYHYCLRLVSKFPFAMSLGHAPFVTSHISLKIWPSDKTKENCDTNLIRIADNNHATTELS